ncbi:diacylglycerol O-acyltransferase OS=Streptomyces fumanus OX=67302 GN=GCM10018772_10670 PE=3 SV=1 [Streptomyces fumanus]
MSNLPAPRPSPVDRHLHRAARALRHHGGYLGVLGVLEGTPPSVGELRDLVADTVPRVPAWHYRVCADNRRVWEHAGDQDPRAHVHELRVPEGPAALERIGRAVLDAPFPQGADNWGVWLVTGWAADRYAIACRVHHALQDAAGGMAGLSAVMFPGWNSR